MTEEDDKKYIKFIKYSMELIQLREQIKQLEMKLEKTISNAEILEANLESILYD